MGRAATQVVALGFLWGRAYLEVSRRRSHLAGLVAAQANAAEAWIYPSLRKNSALVRDTTLEVLAEAPGHPRSQEDLPEEEQVLLQIWTAATMYSLESPSNWSQVLKDELQELRHSSLDVVAPHLLASLGDAYAQYLAPRDWAEIQDVAEAKEVVGIGLAFAPERRERRARRERGAAVVSVVPGSAAARQGVRVSDRLVAVDGHAVKDFGEAARRVPGPRDTWARVSFQREGVASVYSISLQRQEMRVGAVEFHQLSDRAGCIHIISFNGPQVASPVRGALQDMARLGLVDLVVDLRENCGGRLRDAQEVVKLIRGADFLQGLAFLVTSRTSSAAELLITELKELKAPVVFCGEGVPKTYGKAEEQEAIELSNGGSVLLTTARWAEAFTGIEADLVCNSAGEPDTNLFAKRLPPWEAEKGRRCAEVAVRTARR